MGILTVFIFFSLTYTMEKKEHGPELELGESIVLDLLKSIIGLGCELYIDNFFNSPTMQCYLAERNIRCCGTVRPMRKHMPKDFPAHNTMKRGDVSHFTCNGISAINWMDNKPVYLLSNFISPNAVGTFKCRSSGSTE